MKGLTDNSQYMSQQAKELRPGFIETLPQVSKSSLNYIDSEPISRIRALPLVNDVYLNTISNLYRDILQLIRFEGAGQSPDAIDDMRTMIDTINDTAALRLLPTDTIPDKGAATIKDWVKYLKGLHPRLDLYLQDQKNVRLSYFKNISDQIGSITVLHSADTSTIDPSAWGNQTDLTSNNIEKTTTPWFAPNFIRETMRQKMSSSVVNFIQSSNSKLTVSLQRNLPTETWKTTAPNIGSEVWQVRPVQPVLTQGAHLNADWYHWQFRVYPPIIGLKEKGLMDSLDYLNRYFDRGDYTVHVLLQHLHSMKPYAEAEGHGISMSQPFGPEDTFPTKDSNISLITDLKGQPLLNRADYVDNTILKPKTGENI